MRPVNLAVALLILAACDPFTSPAHRDDLASCADIHCTTVECEATANTQVERSCTCHWPPAYDVQCMDSVMVDRMLGCAEQADLWCTRAGFPGAGCVVWYVQRCMPSGPDSVMYDSELAGCLAAIVTTPTPDVEPLECLETWR